MEYELELHGDSSGFEVWVKIGHVGSKISEFK